MKTYIILISALLSLLLSSCECRKAGEKYLTLFVAASLTDVIQEVGQAYEDRYDVDLIYNFASSGALAQQLMASPRADLFLSASQRWMDEVEKDGKIKEGSRTTLLGNQLVVIANRHSDITLGDPLQLAELSFEFLAMGDPASVPAGRYGKKWLQSLSLPKGQNLWSELEDKMSPAPDVRSALVQVQGSEDVLGIVYKTDYMSRRDSVRLLYEVPVEVGPRIEYVVGVLKETQRSVDSLHFLAFLKGDESGNIFSRHGFMPLGGCP